MASNITNVFKTYFREANNYKGRLILTFLAMLSPEIILKCGV